MNKGLNNNMITYINDILSDKDFRKLSDFIETNYGVKMPEQKKTMLQSRLKKRLNTLNINTYKEYIDYTFNKNTHEIQHMIDVVTTHKTDFFREKEHFDFITGTALPTLIHKKVPRNIKVLSAGCSTGEEPYTVAISLLESKSKGLDFDFSISACDISPESVMIAKKGIYPLAKIKDIPTELKQKYFLKNKIQEKQLVKIMPSVLKYIRFFVLNLLEENYKINEAYDIILCRNTLIYFNRTIQEKVLGQLCKKLKPSGYLIIGHSESIIGMNLPVDQIKPTIFIKNLKKNES